MKEAHPFEKKLGMEFYSTDFPGMNGRVKARFEDFIVAEISPEEYILQIKKIDKIDEWQGVEDSIIEGEKDRFVRFVMQKIGLSTMDVVHILAAELNIPRHLVTYAGLKDKRAITAQFMSVPSSDAERLANCNLSRILIRELEYVHRQINIGDLWGNRFRIRLEGITLPLDQALEFTRSMDDGPILNYFGVQRFGVTRPFTHRVGKALTKRDYEEAIMIMLTETSDYESEELTNIRNSLAEDFVPTENMLEIFPEDQRYERRILEHLIRHPNDFERALQKIPPRIQTIFVHAYQSYLFNRLISMRARAKMSLEMPIVGDFLIRLDIAHSGRDSWIYVTKKKLDSCIDLVESGEYGLAAPIPGYTTKTPPSPQTDMLREILNSEEISLIEFRNSGSRALNSPGGLHLLSVRPHKLKVSGIKDELILEFSLRKGSYATIIMRELMKSHPINRV
ncbi:MAG: putative tRNA pseudouridine synthase D [Candidatus Thorarchaeota archaeon]|nr:MAG: putative tRNA pseudouridine synthase D [Candidatus Thorarchaeota archaeon]